MSPREKYLKLLSSIVPAGAVGASLLLGLAAPAAAKPDAASTQAVAPGGGRIAERLAAIRDAVSEVAGQNPHQGTELAWWGNWRNGGGGWRNGGWRNGGWRNGGWRNGGWNNFWRNW